MEVLYQWCCVWGIVLLRLTVTSMLEIECSSDKWIIGWIADLTLLTDQIHLFTVFQSKYRCNKVTGFTTHLAMRKGRPSPRLPSLLARHDLCWFLALSIPTHRSSIWVFISQIDGVYRQRRLVADITAIGPEPIRSDAEITHSVTRV